MFSSGFGSISDRRTIVVDRQKLIQDSFYPRQLTAHVTNSEAYTSINQSNAFSMVKPGADEEAISWALTFLERENIRFMRIHLQDTGAAGNLCATTAEAVPWKQNIWAEGSPYVAKAREADRLLGTLVAGLKAMGKWDDTLLVATSDHGQVATGWHPLMPEDAWITPLVFRGPGVAAGRRIAYAEHTDIVPTISHLMGVTPPSCPGSGMVLEEILVDGTPAPTPRRQRIRELNEVLREFMLLQARARLAAVDKPQVEAVVLRQERVFYGLDRFLDWHQAGSIDNLLKVNRDAVEQLESAVR